MDEYLSDDTRDANFATAQKLVGSVEDTAQWFHLLYGCARKQYNVGNAVEFYAHCNAMAHVLLAGRNHTLGPVAIDAAWA